MYTLHALWKQDHLYLWAESQKQGKSKAADEHPFAATQSQLISLLKNYAPSQNLRQTQMTISLPTAQKAPLASFDTSLQADRFADWVVPVIQIGSEDALELLAELSPSQKLALGPSCEYFQKIASVAGDLLRAGAFLPATELIPDTQYYTSYWKPFLSASEEATLREVAKRMPWSNGNLVYDFLEKTMSEFIKKHATDMQPSLKLRDSATLLQACNRWLLQLHNEDGLYHLDGSYRQVATLVKRLNESTEKFVATSRLLKSFKTGFRLISPAVITDPWTIEFFLQAEDDPSLIILAADAWHKTLKHYENPGEKLLVGLMYASQTYKKIEEAFTNMEPTHIELTLEEAYSFLREHSERLQQNGFTIQVPSWYTKKKRLTSTVTVKKESSGLLSMHSILDYDWQVSIEDKTVTADELEELVSLKSPLIQVQGEWIELRKEDVESIMSFDKKDSRTMTMAQALKLSFESEHTLKSEGLLSDFLKKLQNPHEVSFIPTPETFQGILRPYQSRGVSWLNFLKQTGFGMCLADDMGLGKTIQIIALLLHTKEDTTASHLLICPLSVIGNWQKELVRFAPTLKVLTHHGIERHDKEAFQEVAKQHDIVLTTYAIAARDREELESVHWDSVILDEAQNIKNSATKQTQAIKQLQSIHRIALTGTPVENRLSELWSLMDFLNKGYLGSLDSFTKKFISPIERQSDTKRSDQLKRLIQPFLLRRVKTDKAIIQDLPDKIETKELCYLTKEQTSLYQALVSTMLQAIDKAEGIERKGLVLTTLLKLKQICNHPVNFLQDNSALAGRSGKLHRLEELLEEIVAEGGKSLIFTQFAQMGALLKKHLSTVLNQDIPFLEGKTPKVARDRMVESFQSSKGPSVFILSLKAGGIGLNLTEANHVFHFDRWWNPAVENQATDRAFRIGQKRVVQVHPFITAGTVEERIDSLIERKKHLVDLVVSTGEHWISELSTEELKELFTLE